MLTISLTEWKVAVFGVILVRILPHSDCIESISPYSVRMRENTDQNNYEYEHFLRSVYHLKTSCFLRFSGGINMEHWLEMG